MELTTQRAVAPGEAPAACLDDLPDEGPPANMRKDAATLAEDEHFVRGQLVVVVARWLLVLAGLLLTLWEPNTIALVRVELFGLLSLAVVNFYLHAQLLMRRPMERRVAYLASLGDLTLITLLILFQGGFPSELYVFYFPALLALSVAFPPATTFTLAGGAVAAYGSVAFASTALQLTDTALQTIVVRCLMLAGVAFCGSLYWRIERDRRAAARGATLERAEDLFFGQVVTIWARWFVILAGAVLSLWSASSVPLLAAEILVVVAMMATNFFLHARYLMERPVNRRVVIAGSALDLLCITLVVSSWGPSFGLDSPFFVFYYPVVLAFAFVFPPRLGAAFTICAVLLYGLTCIAVDPAVALHMGTLKLLADRVITLAAIGGLAGYYWRVQRQRHVVPSAGEPRLPHFEAPRVASGAV